jgi:hypothetical protein
MRLVFIILVLNVTLFAQTPYYYNADVTDLGHGNKKYRLHASHINYKNGDKFERINTALNYDAKLKVWSQNKASYSCEMPEYADSWFSFVSNFNESNTIIKAKPVASHVAGSATNDGEGNNYVFYKDAFGTGRHLKANAAREGLVKEIVIDAKPAEGTDLVFNFELDLPMKDIKDQLGNIKNVGNIDFTGEILKIGDAGKELYFTKAMMWDSRRKAEPVRIKVFRSGSTVYLQKTVPWDFLRDAVYPVMTDHPTNYYAGNGDGYVANYREGSSFSAVRGASDGTQAAYGSFITNSTYNYEYYYSSDPANSFAITRGFFPIDTQSIGDSDNITAATLYIRFAGRSGDSYISVVQSTQANTASLATGDFDQLGTTKGSNDITMANISTSAYTGWTLNATGIGWISKTGYTKLGTRYGKDIDNQAPGSQVSYNGTCYYSGYTGTDRDPYLDVTVSAGTPGSVVIITE